MRRFNYLNLFIVSISILLFTSCAIKQNSESKKETFASTQESLNKHQSPEWFRDAKFGIYTHWTPTTIGNELIPCG